MYSVLDTFYTTFFVSLFPSMCVIANKRTVNIKYVYICKQITNNRREMTAEQTLE